MRGVRVDGGCTFFSERAKAVEIKPFQTELLNVVAGFLFRGEHLWILSCYNITIRWVLHEIIFTFIVVMYLTAVYSSFMLHTCVSDMAKSFSVVVFHCRHMFHKECLPSQGTVSNSTSLKSLPLCISHMLFHHIAITFISETQTHITISLTFSSFLSQFPGMQFCNICSAKRRGPGSGILEMKK